MKRVEAKPCWSYLNDVALWPDNLPRVLGAMAFDRYCGSSTRGAIKWWQPDYVRIPSVPILRERTRQFVATDVLDHVVADRHQRLTAEWAPLNRALRDAAVHLLALSGRIVCVDGYQGEWRSADGANRGRDLIDLGMWRWSCKFGQAAGRIARLIGMSSIPKVAA
jgi:hypothetical protein